MFYLNLIFNYNIYIRELLTRDGPITTATVPLVALLAEDESPETREIHHPL